MSYYSDASLAIPKDYASDDDWGHAYEVSTKTIHIEEFTSEQLIWVKEQLVKRIFARRMHKLKIKWSEEFLIRISKEEERRAQLYVPSI